MDIRYSANQRDVKRYTTEELRNEFLIQNLYQADEVVAVYSHVDVWLHWDVCLLQRRFLLKRASTAGKTLVPIISWSAVRSVFLILAVKERSLQTDRNMRWVTKTVCTLPREQKKFTLKVKMLPSRQNFIW